MSRPFGDFIRKKWRKHVMCTTSNIPCNPGCQYRACTRSKLKRFERKRVQHGDIRSAARPHDTGGYTSLFWFYCRWPVCGEGRPTSMRAIYSVCAQSGYTYDKTGRVSNIILLTLVLYIIRGNHGTTDKTQDVIPILFVLMSL